MDINNLMQKLSKRRPIFVSEADFQLELAWLIKETYPEAKVRLEYCPTFDPSMHLDILAIMNGNWCPIELKYKKSSYQKVIDNETFNLKNDGARDISCYLYLKDIQRIESIKDNIKEFAAGYTIILTNDLGYTKKSSARKCAYDAFSIEEEAVKTGKLDWRTGYRTANDKQVQNPICLKGLYPMHWETYSKLDDTKTGTFAYNINEIK